MHPWKARCTTFFLGSLLCLTLQTARPAGAVAYPLPSEDTTLVPVAVDGTVTVAPVTLTTSATTSLAAAVASSLAGVLPTSTAQAVFDGEDRTFFLIVGLLVSFYVGLRTYRAVN